MAFFYHRAHNLVSLFPELYNRIKEERRRLKPQTPQTIIVGSLDVEAWIEEQFIERDGVLMGVHFPFLEAALETFAERRARALMPSAHESWFSAPPAVERSKKAGMLQLELAVLNQLLAVRKGEAKISLGYKIQDLSSLQLLTLAQRLAREIRECLLHAPEAMQKFLRGKPAAPIGKIWKMVHTELNGQGYISGMFGLGRERKENEEEPSLFSAQNNGSALYLFGMPVLSAYHIRRLCAIAQTVDVHLMSIHPVAEAGTRNDYYLGVVKKYETYLAFVRKTARETKAVFSELSHTAVLHHWQKTWLSATASTTAQSPVEFLGLPGLWRGAEIIGDLWHEKMRNDAAIRQDDFSLMLTDPAVQLPAFDKACGSRRLAVFARNRLFERPQPVAELVSILAEAAGDGTNRDLLVRYFSNPIVRERYRLDAEKTNLYIRALVEANGFRNDYSGSLEIFNLSLAMTRLRLGLIVDPKTAVGEATPGAAYIRSLDTAETLAEFISCIEILAQAAVLLKPQRGADLVRQWHGILERFQSTPSLEFNAVLEALAEIAVLIPDQELTALQVARILNRNLPGKNLAQSAQRQGICASPLNAPAPFRRFVTLWDMNEDLDAAPENEDGLLPEYLTSPTRLRKNELVAIHLIQAALSGSEALQICYDRFDPETGAEKYRSVEIERFKASLQAANLAFAEREHFPQTIFDAAPGFSAIASDGDVGTVRLMHSHKNSPASLPQLLLPALPKKDTNNEISIRDLIGFVLRPFHYFYQRLTTLPEDPADFRYGEPKLAESKGSRFRFVEAYIKNVILSPHEPLPGNPLVLLAAEQRRGLAEPEGFDFMQRLLSTENNAGHLRDFSMTEANKFRVAEYVFDTRVQQPFSVQETERLTRHYFPALNIGSLTITGTTDKLLTTVDDNYVYLTGSARDEDRTRDCITAYIQLAILRAATKDLPERAPFGIKVLRYNAETEADSNPPVLSVEPEIRFTAEEAKTGSFENYLAGIGKSFFRETPPYFDARLIGANKLSGFAAKADAEILDTLTKEREKSDAADFLAEFYQAALNEDSVTFFNQCIRPVAEADAMNSKRGSKKK